MDTHQGGLPSDMLRAAKHIGDAGEEIPASVWTGGSGGHHLSGTLSVRSGKLATVKTVALLLIGIEGHDARFEWKLPPKVSAGSSAGTR